MRYRNFSGWLKEKYGEPVGKICIDGGFTCPNRDGKCGFGGCIFCGERGAGEHLNPTLSVREQVQTHFSHPHKQNKFIAYFQNFTGTYAPTETLRERYDSALIDERIVALAVGTRPDCIDEETVALLASFRDRVDVWVELGLQTASDETAKRINRGYPRAVFERAVNLLTAANIPVVVHIMVGLPGEAPSDALDTVRYLSRFPLFGVKIHSTYVTAGTKLAELYEAGEYLPLTREEYVDTVASAIALLPASFVVHRLTADPPAEGFLAPAWSADKNATLTLLSKVLDERNVIQGQDAPKGEKTP